MAGVFDMIFFFYFLTHIPITIFVDSQAVFPKHYYPQMLQDILQWHTRELKDSMMANPPAWFQSFCVCEVLVQFPFFFIATYAFWKGSSKCKWIRIPAMLYGSHVTTTVIPIIAHILFHDFSEEKSPGPSSLNERLTLASIYSPYLIIPFLLVLHSLFSSSYKSPPSVQKKKVK